MEQLMYLFPGGEVMQVSQYVTLKYILGCIPIIIEALGEMEALNLSCQLARYYL